MEIVPEVMPDEHPYFERQIQKMSLGQTDILYDTMKITVTGADQGSYMLAFLNDATNEYSPSSPIVAGCSASDMQTAIAGYYTAKFSVSPLVTATYLDSTGAETTEDGVDVFTIDYLVEVPTILTEASVTSIIMVATTTSATVEFVYPADLQLSSPPLSGKFYVECIDVDGGAYATEDMDLDVTAADF
jgi:hypothetical protein